MRLARGEVNGAPRVLLVDGDSYSLATVGGQGFGDVPALLGAAGEIEPGASVEAGEALPVVGMPGKILCVGRNYRAHAAERGAALSDHPLLFPKWHTSLAGPYADIPLPPESSEVDWESELALVIGSRGRRVSAEKAGGLVFGYTVANDVTMRDFQRHTQQFAPGKAWDRSTPIGPALVTADELGGVAPDLAIRGRLNGETVQDSRTADLIFGIPELLAYITTWTTLEPGDLVLTGTPAGVGAAMDPPRFLSDGDVFEVEVEGIGSLRNTFHNESL
jgi:acylpyruvate hydrolase